MISEQLNLEGKTKDLTPNIEVHSDKPWTMFKCFIFSQLLNALKTMDEKTVVFDVSLSMAHEKIAICQLEL